MQQQQQTSKKVYTPTKLLPRYSQPVPTMGQRRAARQVARERFLRARKATHTYARQLTAVARQVGMIVKGIAPDGVVENMPTLNDLLEKYAQLIRPWAIKVASQMIAEVGQRDETAWVAMGREIGRELREEIRTAPTGEAMRALLDEQVHLITSIPLKASQRVQKLAIESYTNGGRAAEIAGEIMRTEHVTKSRAMLIARTEVARTASVMTQVRSEHIGSKGYIWRTAHDSDVRELHKHLEGHFIPWDTPPIAAQDGIRAHAGQIFNCRCWAEPVLPDIID